MNYYTENYLSHHGILGMKWGIRKNSSGGITANASKRKLKKAMKSSDNQAQDKVTKAYREAISKDSELQSLAKELSNVKRKIAEQEELEYNQHLDANQTGDYDISPKLESMYQKKESLGVKIQAHCSAIGKQYISEFNNARLKDIKFQGTSTEGKKFLEKYKSNYILRRGLVQTSPSVLFSYIVDPGI